MNDKIFVMLPAYIDPDLAITLTEMYTKADNPENLTVAVGTAYINPEDEPVQNVIPENQLKKLSWNAYDRPGTMKVRSLLNDFYTDEQYYLSIDSHMVFSDGWDTSLKKELNDLSNTVDNNKVILINHIRSCRFTVLNDDTRPLFTLKGSSIALSPDIDGRFARGDFLFAGLFFTYGNFAKDVGWIKDVNMVLEEPYMSFRSYLKGWDIYHNFTQEYYTHNPDNYYLALKNQVPPIGWNDDPERYFIEVLFAMLFNDNSIFAIEDPERTPDQWWNKVGLLREAQAYRNKFVEYDVLENIEDFAKKFKLR